jgi:TIR domain-containing protein
MATVFLSYAREDVERIRLLAAALEGAGHSVWWDEQVPGGHEYADVIESALDRADAVIVAWTRTSVRSAWVRDEAAAGRDAGKLVPLTLDGAQPPLGFRQYQTIDLSRWTGRADSDLLRPLADAVAARSAAGAAPQPIRRSSSARVKFGRKPLLAGAAGFVVLLTASIVLRLFSAPASAAVSPNVALGDFTAVSAGVPRQLPQAIKDEVLAAFGSEHEVALITGNSRAARFLLDGSIQDLGDAMRFTVNLRDVQTGGLVWSHAFDRAMNDTLGPRQVAVAATQVVRCGIWGAAAYRKRMSDQGLSLYVDWCSEYWGGSPDEDRMLDAARRVAAALPDFSFAWSALALSAVPISHRSNDAEAAAAAREGWQAAEKAIRLDASNPEGYMAEAGLLPTGRFADRERLLQKAISVRPTECGCERQAYGDFLTSVGRNEESVAQYDRARAMMPLAPMSNVRLAQSLYLVGRASEARQIVSDMLNVWPDAEIVRILQIKAGLWTGKYDDAATLVASPELTLADPERGALVHTFAALQSKNPAAAAEATNDLILLAQDARGNDRLVVAGLAALNAQKPALNAASSLIRERGPALADVLFEPNLARASSSEQYGRVVDQLGLSAYWRASGHGPDVCRGAAGAPFCSSKGRPPS